MFAQIAMTVFLIRLRMAAAGCISISRQAIVVYQLRKCLGRIRGDLTDASFNFPGFDHVRSARADLQPVAAVSAEPSTGLQDRRQSNLLHTPRHSIRAQ